ALGAGAIRLRPWAAYTPTGIAVSVPTATTTITTRTCFALDIAHCFTRPSATSLHVTTAVTQSVRRRTVRRPPYPHCRRPCQFRLLPPRPNPGFRRGRGAEGTRDRLRSPWILYRRAPPRR